MYEPTPEQAAIVAFARERRENLLINALAGCAKTSTLELICGAIRDIPILSLAFNKRIADELVKRLPSHVECRTLNALGHRVWSEHVGRRLIVDTKKMGTILKAEIGRLSKRDQAEGWEDFADTLRWISRAKRDGIVPWQFNGPHKPVLDWEDFVDRYDTEPSHQQTYLLAQCLRASVAAAFEGGVDFDDQIYMPVVFGGKWPKFPLTLVDEAQDLNPLQHQMLALLVGDRRLIAVGDPYQSIYGFRGAVANGMQELRARFAMAELGLSVTFRVPVAGVIRQRERVPNFQYADGAIVGLIEHLDTWGSGNIPDNAAILCRNNAPLIGMAFRLLRAGRSIRLVGMDIGPGLIKVLHKLGPPDMSRDAVLTAIADWCKIESAKSRHPERIEERAECLYVLASRGRTLQEIITLAENLFKQAGPIQLMSGHKAKGLEWDTVFHLDPDRIPSPYARSDQEIEQELNVRYVIETRFRRELFIVKSDGWTAEV